MLVGIEGSIRVNERQSLGEAEVLLLSRDGSDVTLQAESDAKFLVLTGEPIDEPIAGHGPFVMNTEAEINQAIDDFSRGRFAAVT